MTLSCLSLPFRLLGLALFAAVLYLGWINRDEIRRVIHRATADSGAAPAPQAANPISPAGLAERGRAKLDSLSRATVDSVVLSPAEVAAMVSGEIERQAGDATDSVTVLLDDRAVAVRGRVDASRLPREALGLLADWIKGKQTVEARGPFGLARVGFAEWRIDRVSVQGVPLPRALWGRLVSIVTPSGNGVLTIPVAKWVTGIRVAPAGVTLYGGRKAG